MKGEIREVNKVPVEPRRIVEKGGMSPVLSKHDPRIAQQAYRIIQLRHIDGAVFSTRHEQDWRFDCRCDVIVDDSVRAQPIPDLRRHRRN